MITCRGRKQHEVVSTLAEINGRPATSHDNQSASEPRYALSATPLSDRIRLVIHQHCAWLLVI